MRKKSASDALVRITSVMIGEMCMSMDGDVMIIITDSDGNSITITVHEARSIQSGIDALCGEVK